MKSRIQPIVTVLLILTLAASAFGGQRIFKNQAEAEEFFGTRITRLVTENVVVAIGEIVEAESFRVNDVLGEHLMTENVLKVKHLMKAPEPLEEVGLIRFLTLGGIEKNVELSDGTVSDVRESFTDSPLYDVGEQVLLYLKPTPADLEGRDISLIQALGEKIRIEKEGEQEIVRRFWNYVDTPLAIALRLLQMAKKHPEKLKALELEIHHLRRAGMKKEAVLQLTEQQLEAIEAGVEQWLLVESTSIFLKQTSSPSQES